MDPADTVPSVTVEVSWRRSRPGKTAVLRKEPGGQGWEELGRVEGTTFRLEGVQPERSLTLAAAPVLEDGGLAAEIEWEYLVWTPTAPAAGGPALPDTPAGFAVAQDGGYLNFAWDAPADGVTKGMEIRVGSSWEDGQLVARDLSGGSYSWPWWTSGSQTFWVKGQDGLGRYSLEGAERAVDVKALDEYVTANTWDESAGGFAGTKTNMEVDGGELQLTKLDPFGGLDDPFASYEGLPPHSRYWHEGSYLAPAQDLGQVENERFEVAFAATQPVDADLPFGAYRHPVLGPRARADGTLVPLGTRGLTSKTSWRGTPFTPLDVTVEVNTSPTNTALLGSVVWDGWRPFVPGSYRARWVQFRVTARGDGLRFVRIPTFLIRNRRLNKKDEGIVAVALDPGPTIVNFATPFNLAPVFGAWPVGTNDELKVDVVATTKTQATVRVYAKERWIEVPLDFGDFALPALEAQVTLHQLPAGWEVTETFINPTTAFAGPGFTAVSLALGTATAGLEDCLAPDFDVLQAPGGGIFQRTSPDKLFSKTAGTTLKARLTGDQNLDGLVAGEVTVRIKIRPVTSDALQEVFTGTLHWHAKGV